MLFVESKRLLMLRPWFVATAKLTFPVAPLTVMPDPAITESTIDVQPGAVDAPVDTIACPLVDPTGLSI
jgi:hypothetical protein